MSVQAVTEGRWVSQGAPPCASCGTRGGYVGPGDATPIRTRDLCPPCYLYHRDSDTLDRFLTLRPSHTGPDARVRLREVWERRDERQDLIAARVARHEDVTPLVEGFRNTDRRSANAHDYAAGWLATHPDQRASWDRDGFAVFGEGEAK